MVTLPLARFSATPSVPWRSIVVIVLAKAAWDSVGLLAGDAAYTAPSYDVLRSMPPAGGMRVRGLILAAVTVAALWSAHRAAQVGHAAPLRLCLGFYAVWYMGWALGLAASWIYHGRILAWSAPATVLVAAVLALIAARATPRQIGGA